MAENHRVEYKLKLTESFEKEVVAFLNKDGGELYLGVDDNGKAVGIRNIDTTLLKIKDRFKNNIAPSCMGLFDMAVVQREGIDVIKITLASGLEKPYYIKKRGLSEKGCFIRIGTAAEPMPHKMIDDLYAKRTRNSISKIQSTQQQLKFEQLRIYYQETGRALNQHFASNLELLTSDKKYNYVAYLLSDTNNVSIKVAKYNGLNRVDLVENNEYGNCSLIKAAKAVLDKIDLENKRQAQITAKERKEQRLWNPIALREAIINAIVHNDYTAEVPPKFELFDDRIEITSKGGLPKDLSQEEFFEGFSVPRNKELMRVFSDLDLVEQLGSGIPRILATYPKTCFRFSDNFLRMTFPASGTMGGTVSGTMSGIIEDLTSKQLEVLELIRQNNRISYRKLAEQLSMNLSAMQKHVDKLKEKGYIARVGGTRGYWKVNVDNNT